MIFFVHGGVEWGKLWFGMAMSGMAAKVGWVTVSLVRAWSGDVWQSRRVELNFGAFGCVLAVKVMRVMSRLSGYWQGSQGKARSDKVKHGRVRFGSQGKARSCKARSSVLLLGSQGTSRQRLARCVSVWQLWCVQLSIVGFSNGLAVVAS